MNEISLQYLKREAEYYCNQISQDNDFYKRMHSIGLLTYEDLLEREVTFHYYTRKLDKIWDEYGKCMQDPMYFPYM